MRVCVQYESEKGSRVIGEDKIVILHRNIKQLCKSVIK